MKYLLFLLLATFMSFNTMVAQERGYKIGFFGAYNQYPIIKSNKQTSDGLRLVTGSKFISTTKNSSYTTKSELYFELGLSVFKTGNDSLEYTLDVMVVTTDLNNLYVFKDSPMLIKLYDDEVIKLFCKEKAEDNIGEVVSLAYNIHKYTIIAQYKISKEDIEKFKKGIKKIRLEVNAEKRDYEYKRYKEDEVGAFLFDEYNLITKTLSEQVSFESDF